MEAYVHFKLWGRRRVSIMERLHCYEIYWQLVLRKCSSVLIVSAILQLTREFLPKTELHCDWPQLLSFCC